MSTFDPHTTTPRGGVASTMPSTSVPGRFEVEDWCYPTPWIWATACEQFLNYPVWSSVLLADVVGLWMIAAIMLRQKQQDRGFKSAKLAVPRVVRVRRAWRAVRSTIRLATFRAVREQPRGASRLERGAWDRSWQAVTKARSTRKEYLYKKDFSLNATLTRAVGPLLMCVVLMIVAFLAHAVYYVALPWLSLGPQLERFIEGVGLLIPVRILQDYFRTAFTNPGRPQDNGAKAMGVGADLADYMAADVELGSLYGRELRRCQHCDGPKPARAHHCKVCRSCVLKMDHHCPFINNCVGLRNHRYFCFFLLDVSVGTFLTALLLTPQVADVLWFQRYPATFAHRVHVVAAFLLSMSLQSGMIPFLLFHVQLILWNETTLEFISKRTGNRGRRSGKNGDAPSYSKGAMENFIEVCGAPPVFCEQRLRMLLEWMVPQRVAKLAKRSA